MTATSHPEFNQHTTALEVAAAFPTAVKGRTILITGANIKGLGFGAAEGLASQAPRCLVLAGRSPSRVQECIDALKQKYPDVALKGLQLDLASQASVHRAAREFLSWDDVPTLDILINNAGVVNVPERTMSADQIELHFATNHVGHFLFTNLVMGKLIAAAAAAAAAGTTRVINVSSTGCIYSPIRFSDVNFATPTKYLPHEERPNVALTAATLGFGADTDTDPVSAAGYLPLLAYGQSKTANVLFGVALNARLFDAHGVLSLAVHPGAILTEASRFMEPEVLSGWVARLRDQGFHIKTQGQGASTTLTAALDPALTLPVRVDAERGHDYDHDYYRTDGKAAQARGEDWDGKGCYLDDCQISADPPMWCTSRRVADKLWTLSEGLVGKAFSY